MKATIKSYSYRQSGPAHISSGHKKHDVPKHAVRGGNGTYVVSDPPQVIVRYECEDGSKGHVDMYGTIKYNSTRRITEKYVDNLMSLVINQTVDTDNIYDDILQLMARYIE